MRHDAVVPDTFPRQQARTRRFQCGRPRGFAIAGDLVLFIRSAGGSDPVGNLWAQDASGAERLVVDATALLADGDLPPEERARRERMREMTSGITAFSVDRDGARAAFVVSGIPYAVEIATESTTELQSPGPAIDPRMSPDGAHVAFVSGRGMHVADLGTGETTTLCEPEGDHDAWGLADFIAAEELDRHRGHWWMDDSAHLLVEHVDESGVDIRWIADPAQPEVEPTAHRYPSAGTANASLQLWLIGLDGTRRQLEWNTVAFPYLASVHGRIVQLLSRDQRRALICRVDLDQARLTPLIERTDAHWVDVVPGVPRLLPDGALLDIVHDTSADTYRLVRDDQPLTPPGLQVSGVLHADDQRITFLGATQPEEQRVYVVEGTDVTPLTAADRVVNAVVSGAVRVEIASDPDAPATSFDVVRGSDRTSIATLAERPLVEPRPHFLRTGPDALPTVVLLPTGHVPGSGPLPVIVAPYGGPHHARVMRAAGAYAADQWLADQGFAVVVADGRGTPGRGPAWERAVAGDFSGVVADQVAALHGAAAAFPDLDLTRVGITGWSFGGYLAALAVLDRPDVFHAAVAGAPVTEWRLYDTGYTERYLGDPKTNPDAYDRTSLLPRAGQLTRPLLLIHGLADDNVLASHTLQFSSALLAAGRPHSVLPLSGVTHMTPQEVVAENLLLTEVEFLREHLAG